MQQQHSTGLAIRAVTVSREYGSGGGEVARRLAARLGWQLIDHEIIVQVARDMQISEAEVEAYDERSESTVSLILNSMRAIHPAMFAVAPDSFASDSQVYRDSLTRVVEAAATAGEAVIVGRGSQMILRENRDILHVRIVAPLEKRIAYVMRREGVDRNSAESRIHLKDHDRQRYLQAEYHHHPNEAHLYDLIVNTGVLDLDSVVDLITLALERKTTRLSVPVEHLGPAAGLPPYPGQPADFHPPTSD